MVEDHSPGRKDSRGRDVGDAVRAMLDGCPDPLFAFDRQHRLIGANSPFSQEFHELWRVALQPGDLVSAAIDVPGDREQLSQHLDRALMGETFSVQGWWGDASRKRYAYRVTYRPFRDPAGEIVGVVGHARHITRELQADQARILDGDEALIALADAEELFRSTFENAAVGIAHVGLDGRWLRVNQKLCEIVGYSRDELLKLTFQDLTYPEDLEQDVQAIERFAAGKTRHYTREKRYIRKDGRLIWIALTSSLAHDAEGKPAYAISVIQDATERIEAREKLRELADTLEKRVAERTEVVQRQADQLRLLAAQLARAEQRERRRVAETLHDQLQQVLAAAKMRLSRMMSRLERTEDVQFARQTIQLLEDAIEASRGLAVELSPPVLFDVGLLPAVHWLASHMGETHGLTVSVDEQDDAPEPASPEIRSFVFQAMRELLVNVIRHAGVDAATIEMSQAEDGRLRLCVRDAGRGLRGVNPLDRGDMERFGLFSIEQRLKLLGGRLSIDDAETGGCIVEMLVPIDSLPVGPVTLDRFVN